MSVYIDKHTQKRRFYKRNLFSITFSYGATSESLKASIKEMKQFYYNSTPLFFFFC